MKFGLIGMLAVGATFAFASPALAQDKDLVPDEVQKTGKKKEGWDTTLSVGATVNFVDNRNVVGQNEGSTWTLGGTIKGDTKYKKGPFEFRSSLNINENFTRSPVIPEFLNTADSFIIDASGYYSFLAWLGVYGRAEMNTNLFNNYFATAVPTQFAVTELDGSVGPIGPSDRLLLKTPFGLTTFKESLGLFARPYSEKFLDVEVRLGAGAREVLANEQIAIDDNKDTTDVIEAKRLQNFVQIGAEAALVLQGAVSKNRVAYKSSFEALMPFYNSINPQDKGVLELTNVDWTTTVSFKLVEWASLDYQLKVMRQPLILDEWQVQNSLLLTFGYTLIDDVEKK